MEEVCAENFPSVFPSNKKKKKNEDAISCTEHVFTNNHLKMTSNRLEVSLM